MPTPLPPVFVPIVDFFHFDVTVPVGTEVTWDYEGDSVHSTTSGVSPNPDDIWNSDFLFPGDSFSFTFNEVGSFPYFCMVHPTEMFATVTVVAEGVGVTGVSPPPTSPDNGDSIYD